MMNKGSFASLAMDRSSSSQPVMSYHFIHVQPRYTPTSLSVCLSVSTSFLEYPTPRYIP